MNPHLAGSWAGGDWGEQDIGEDGSPPLSHYQLPGQPIQNDFILSLNVRSFTAGSKTEKHPSTLLTKITLFKNTVISNVPYQIATAVNHAT